MFNLIANAMFEATRIPAPPTAPLRNRWFVNRPDDVTFRSSQWCAPSDPGGAKGDAVR
jgi:hypothetical protein